MPKPRTRLFLTVHGTEIEMNKPAGTIDWRSIFDNSGVLFGYYPCTHRPPTLLMPDTIVRFSEVIEAGDRAN
jgi:hypothetical protein